MVGNIAFNNWNVYRKNLTTENLNNVTLTGNYIQHNNTNALATRNYPLDGIAGMLSVVNGNSGQIYQTYHTYTNNEYYYRCYYSSAWREWKRLDYYGTQKVLWGGTSSFWMMTSGHIIKLSEPISEQRNGIVLVFNKYVSGTLNNSDIHACFIPKKVVELLPGRGHTFWLSTSNGGTLGLKYLYINDSEIKGYDANDDVSSSALSSGVKVNSNQWVLNYIIGV